MPQGTLDDSRAQPGPLQRLAWSLVLSGGWQVSARESAKPSETPWGSLDGSRAVPRPEQSPVEAPGNTGRQRGLMSTLEKGCAEVRVSWGSALALAPTPHPRQSAGPQGRPHHRGPPGQRRPGLEAARGPHLPSPGKGGGTQGGIRGVMAGQGVVQSHPGQRRGQKLLRGTKKTSGRL